VRFPTSCYLAKLSGSSSSGISPKTSWSNLANFSSLNSVLSACTFDRKKIKGN
jgi:hypothetical protein